MCSPKPPSPPNPNVVAAAQSAGDLTTATGNAVLQNINKYGPDGNETYNITGYETVTNPLNGQSQQVPKYEFHKTLSEEGQKAFDQNALAATKLATLGNTLSGTLGSKLTKNFTLGNEATEARLMSLGRKRLDPLLADSRAAQQTQLSNQGIKLGSKAYEKAMTLENQKSTDAYNQLMLNGRAMANNEALTEDNQRTNQINALRTGGQVSQPQFTPYQGQQMPNFDYGQAYQNQYQGNMNQYNAQQSNRAGILSGIGGLFALSDKDAKTDIKNTGRKINGQELHTYRYKGESKAAPVRLGLIAQKVEKKMPGAVMTGQDGYKRVNYGMALGRRA